MVHTPLKWDYTVPSRERGVAYSQKGRSSVEIFLDPEKYQVIRLPKFMNKIFTVKTREDLLIHMTAMNFNAMIMYDDKVYGGGYRIHTNAVFIYCLSAKELTGLYFDLEYTVDLTEPRNIKDWPKKFILTLFENFYLYRPAAEQSSVAFHSLLLLFRFSLYPQGKRVLQEALNTLRQTNEINTLRSDQANYLISRI